MQHAPDDSIFSTIDKARSDSERSLLGLRDTAEHAQAEAARVLQICNACRYCEGFCAVFPAMTRRLAFEQADVHYLANLCHNCGACLHACQYAPPHEFGVNIPQAMAKLRRHTYQAYAWPQAFGVVYQKHAAVMHGLLIVSLAVLMALAVLLSAPGEGWSRLTTAHADGNFYRIFPHGTLVTLFGAVFGWAVLAIAVGVRRFWRDGATMRDAAPDPVTPGAAAPSGITLATASETSRDALRLTYLDGGNDHGLQDGCHNASDAPTHWRRRWHHLTVWGFLLCFASTSLATLYHYLLGWQAPYPIALSLQGLPVVLGTVGGVMLTLGPIGLISLSRQRHPQHGDAAQGPIDRGFAGLLAAISVTGLALMLWRDTAAMGSLLIVHLACVLTLFATLPYGKFAHAPYRVVALLRYAVERRLPSRLRLGAD